MKGERGATGGGGGGRLGTLSVVEARERSAPERHRKS